jgi:serine/threonine-protein kinase
LVRDTVIKRKAQAAGKLTHPNVVTAYDVGEDLGMSFIVMEFAEEKTLTQLMKKQRLSLPLIRRVLANAAIGLDYAHQNGIFHRDVKPDDIMASKTGVVKVLDFGNARVLESSLTKIGASWAHLLMRRRSSCGVGKSMRGATNLRSV